LANESYIKFTVPSKDLDVMKKRNLPTISRYTRVVESGFTDVGFKLQYNVKLKRQNGPTKNEKKGK